MAERPHVLVIVQNLPVPLDRRVWLECRALRDAGFEVSVICPKGPGDPSYAVIDDIHLYKYRPAPQATGLLGYAVEFGYSWLRTAHLSRRVWRRAPFQALQACNPPDTYWALAKLWKRRNVRFVFDQHDLNPELFLSRFGEPQGWGGRAQLAGLRWLERRTYATSDHVISTNESYQQIAVERGGLAPEDVTVVRSGPDTTVMRPIHPPEGSSRHSLVYLGIMGPQDGVDTVLEVMEELVHRRGRSDVEATLLGFGDCLGDLRLQSRRLGLDDFVTFTGRAGPDMIAEHLSEASVGLCPDRKTPLADVSTMNKTMEYMAYALPSVCFDLKETRVSGGDSCLYVDSGDVVAFADAVERLLDDPELRLEMSRRARRRVSLALDWKPQSSAYVSVYDRLLRTDVQRLVPASTEPRYVELGDEGEFRRFVLSKGPQAADHAVSA
ncbi:glycosyltransferase family 4 protein [Nocardioides sp. T2.26MG-1]|uniref:glycosyltransferase family 4 protein n=1 Tax=Nocardioides sp. T2.26MG-1 TaxID=3041166 RepID=UPI002477B010|nr:glycosyltransferase family 4 protein [Nocardioides sp. T2.26MG-1]CAI9398622.1 D-inositol-3-phosphate glycosyltransferase [Nocardioides sp. T2.26MG-1]